MASNLMARAAKQLRAKNETEKRRRVEKKHSELLLIGHGSTIVGAAGGALIDERWGEGDESMAELKGIPANALLGGASVVAGAMTGGKVGAGMLGTGVGLLAATTYQLVREKVDFDDKED